MHQHQHQHTIATFTRRSRSRYRAQQEQAIKSRLDSSSDESLDIRKASSFARRSSPQVPHNASKARAEDDEVDASARTDSFGRTSSASGSFGRRGSGHDIHPIKVPALWLCAKLVYTGVFQDSEVPSVGSMWTVSQHCIPRLVRSLCQSHIGQRRGPQLSPLSQGLTCLAAAHTCQSSLNLSAPKRAAHASAGHNRLVLMTL
jgi:hypothetical protein